MSQHLHAPEPISDLGFRPWPVAGFDIPAYLDMIGVPAGEPTLALLRDLHRAHVRTVPFSDASHLLGLHRGVEPEHVQEKLVERRLGGYCFEHVQLFAAAAERLGFEVVRSLGRVLDGAHPRTHMSVLVTAEGRRWFCDPGLGFSILEPVELTDGATGAVGPQHRFSLHRRTEAGAVHWALQRGDSLVDLTDELPAQPMEAVVGDHYTATHPNSPFTQGLITMKHVEDGHLTVTETTLTRRYLDAETVRSEITPQRAVELTRELDVRLSDQQAAELVELLERKVRELG